MRTLLFSQEPCTSPTGPWWGHGGRRLATLTPHRSAREGPPRATPDPSFPLTGQSWLQEVMVRTARVHRSSDLEGKTSLPEASLRSPDGGLTWELVQVYVTRLGGVQLSRSIRDPCLAGQSCDVLDEFKCPCFPPTHNVWETWHWGQALVSLFFASCAGSLGGGPGDSWALCPRPAQTLAPSTSCPCRCIHPSHCPGPQLHLKLQALKWGHQLPVQTCLGVPESTDPDITATPRRSK